MKENHRKKRGGKERREERKELISRKSHLGLPHSV